MKPILVVMGTRPEAIKLAPVVERLRERFPAPGAVRVCATDQHREMLDQVLRLFDIQPQVRLDVMQPDQTLHDLSARLLVALRRVLLEIDPGLVLVQGDTTSAFIGALAAFYLRIPVGHVEAGLRTYDLDRPFPEEMNRQMVTRVARYHFAPTASARQNLLAEAVPEDRVWITGNTVIDALLETVDRPYRFDGALAPLVGSDRRLVLVTAHRRESFGEGFRRLCRALAEIARRHPECDLLYPVHLNPNVREPVHALLGGLANVHLVPPVDYQPFVHLMKRSHLILTDSGGVQEEAPSLGKPVLVLRERTERPEAVEAGTVRLVGTDPETIVAETERLLTDEQAYLRMSRAHNPYGDGRAAGRIADVLQRSPAGADAP